MLILLTQVLYWSMIPFWLSHATISSGKLGPPE